jgi:hypothetical protein
MNASKKICSRRHRSLRFLVVALCMMTTPVQAVGCAMKQRVIEGELAAELSYVLLGLSNSTKRLGLNSTLVSMEQIRCQRVSRDVFPDHLPAYRCHEPTYIDGLTVKLLWDSLALLNIYGDSGMGRTEMNARNIRCTIDRTFSQSNQSPRCALEAVWKDLCE